MRAFIDVTGKTEDEALRNALAQLGLERDDVSLEILERAKAGFLGLGSCPARIRVYYGPEEEPEAVTKENPPKEEPMGVKSPKPETPKAKHGKAENRDRSQGNRPVPKEDGHKGEYAEKPKTPRPAPKSERSGTEGAERVSDTAAPTQDLGPEVDDEKAQAIRAFLEGLLEHMSIQAQIRVYRPEQGRYKVILDGEHLGALIGRRGETLDAIQQLTSYSVNRAGNTRVRIQLDAEGYREKREQSLQHLARKVAGKVVKYRRSVTLEPMNAYERHVIHTALQDVPGVTTYSTGVDPNRRVIVAPDRGQ